MTVGVIAELNPYHAGHQKLLDAISKKYKDCTLVMILGGNFLQRGIPSIIDKWKKTELALSHGVDLIVELPFPFATQSADIFAKGAISLLKALQVDVLAFGSESDDLEGFKTLVVAQQDPLFDSLVQVFLRMGKNYPTALSCALEELTKTRFFLPNDLLAISYLKAMQEEKATFEVFTVKREDHQNTLEPGKVNLESASSIRRAIQDETLQKGMLSPSLEKYLQKQCVLQDDFFPYLRYKVATEENLAQYLGTSEALAKKLKDVIFKVESYQELLESLHSKNYTYNYLSRMLLHILVGFTKEEAKQFEKPSYLRILGFSNKGKAYLHQIKKDCSFPIISKIHREKDALLNLEMRATKLYSLALSKEQRQDLVAKEFSQPPLQRKENEND